MQPYFAKVLIIMVIADLVDSLFDYEEISDSDDFDIIPKIGKKVTVTCLNGIWSKFSDVKLNSPSVPKVRFENCTYPATMNVPNVLRSMDIKQSFLTEVTLTQIHSIFHRHNFQGLSTPRLNILFYNFAEMPFDLLYDVLNLRSLAIEISQLRSIPMDFFSDWAENITEIQIVSSKLQKIAEHDFQRLVNVKVISLAKNEITVIEPGAFDGLTSLIRLELERNPLRTLPPGLFHQTTSLMRLVLGGNLFDELPQDLLLNTKNLEEFQMSWNYGNLVTLPRGLFKNLTRLKSVNIEFTQLANLPADLFVDCSALDSVNLRENRLESLSSGLFGDTKNLRLLNMNDNRLQLLPAGIFEGLNNSQKVSINTNQLAILPSEVLVGLQSVRDFSVTGNNLTRIDDQFMTYLKSAKSIDLSYNLITFDNRSRVKLPGHQNKSPSYSLNEISSDTSESMRNLDMSVKLKNIVRLHENRITKFNADLINILRYSKEVHLYNNPISEIDLFELPPRLGFPNDNDTGYVIVFMGENPLHCDCNIVDFVHYLNGKNENSMYKILPLEWKRFKCASPAKFENQDINKLHLEELSCLWRSTVPADACNETCDCREYPEKRHLSVDCSHRNLTRIPPMIGTTQTLSIELNMTGNMLQHSPSLNGSYLVNVTSLDLSYNNITKITTDLFSPKLQQLRLHGNSLSRLDSDVISHLSGRNNTLRNITLHRNKWICDCDARELLTFVQMKLTTYFMHGMRCYENHQKLSKMTPIELCKNSIIIIVTSCLSITFLCMIVPSLIALYHKYEREIKIWLYSKQLCLWLVTENELDQDKEYDAFISFLQKDEHFVEKEIVANLEQGPRPYKLCLHYRDWLAGEWIPVQISRSVEVSRRTIVVLTPNFLESVWGLLEFRTAHTQALKDGRARLIVIIYGDIGNIDDLDQEMQDYLGLNTYIKWGDPWFWDKL